MRPTDAERALYHVRERQVIRIELATQREIWKLQFSNVRPNSTIYFQRSLWGTDQVWNSTLNANVSVRQYIPRRSASANIDDAAAVRSLLLSDYAGGYGCNDITVTKEGNTSINASVTYTISTGCVPRRYSSDRNIITNTLQTDELLPLIIEDSDSMSGSAYFDSGSGSDSGDSGSDSSSGSGASGVDLVQTIVLTPMVNFSVVQLPTLRASGYYCVSFDGIEKACLNVGTTRTSTIANAIESLSGVADVRVTYSGSFTQTNSENLAVAIYHLEFISPYGADLPELRVVDRYVLLLISC